MNSITNRQVDNWASYREVEPRYFGLSYSHSQAIVMAYVQIGNASEKGSRRRSSESNVGFLSEEGSVQDRVANRPVSQLLAKANRTLND